MNSTLIDAHGDYICKIQSAARALLGLDLSIDHYRAYITVITCIVYNKILMSNIFGKCTVDSILIAWR